MGDNEDKINEILEVEKEILELLKEIRKCMPIQCIPYYQPECPVPTITWHWPVYTTNTTNGTKDVVIVNKTADKEDKNEQ